MTTSRATNHLVVVAACVFLLLPSGALPAAAIATPVAAGTPQATGDGLEGDYLYRVSMLRAAPGDLLEVIDLVKQRLSTHASFDAAGPFWMRHSQGDQWDLMVIYPMSSFPDYYGAEATAARQRAFRTAGVSQAEFESQLAEKVAWQEDWFVWGPPPEALAARFDGTSFFHVEIFLVLPHKRAELLAQRRMENDYLQRIGRQQNVIFTRAGGAAWDLFTLGFYRDIKQYAESADIPADVEEAAAVAAGFEGASYIGSYLRSLISQHHDTLAVAIR